MTREEQLIAECEAAFAACAVFPKTTEGATRPDVLSWPEYREAAANYAVALLELRRVRQKF